MALNNEFKVKNDLNTLGSILSSGTDLLTIFAPSNTSWRLSATNTNFLISGQETLSFFGGNGVDVKATLSNESITFSGINATTSSRGVASFTSGDFDVNNGEVSIKAGGVDNNQLATASSLNLANYVVVRDGAGGFKSGDIHVTGTLGTTSNIAASGYITTTQYLSAQSFISTRTTLSAAQNVQAGGFITVAGNLSAYGNIVSNSNLVVNQNLSAYGAVTFNTDLTVNRNISAYGSIVSRNDITANRNLSATGNITAGDYITTQKTISAFGVISALGGNSEQWNYGYTVGVRFKELSGSYALSAYNTMIADSVSSVPVGGATPIPASEWKSKTLVEVLDTILFPTIEPTYTPTTIAIAFNSGVTNGTTYEVGTTVAPVLQITATKNDAGRYTSVSFQRNNSSINTVSSPTSSSHTAIADQFGYTNPNNPNARYLPTYTDSFVLPTPTTTTWRAIGTYDAGLPKRNNKGATDSRTPIARNVNAPQAAESNFASGTISAISQYRRWVGSVVAPLGTGADYRTAGLTSDLGTANTFITNTNPVYIDKETIVVLIPTGKTLRKVVTASFEVIYDSTDPLTTASWVLSSNALIPDAGGTNRTYNLYYKINATPLDANLIEVTLQ